jgi:Ca-activated chloride channel homolog
MKNIIPLNIVLAFGLISLGCSPLACAQVSTSDAATALSPPSSVQATTPNPEAGLVRGVPESPAAREPQPSDANSPDANSPGPNASDAPDASDQSGMFVFKKDVQEVILHATVLDEQRHLIPGLDRDSFSVSEKGVVQPITSFRRQDVPVAMGIVVDNSGSMRDKRDEVNRAVLNLIRASNPQDEIFIVNFGQDYYLDQDFTSDVHLLESALRQVSSTGSTALYDAIVASAVHLMNNPRLDEKVLLVITDGQDNMSQETLQETALRLQQQKGPTLYAVGLIGNGLQRQGRDALQRLAEGTGGVAYFPENLDQVGNITRTVASDIRSQYVIAFKPTNQNAKPDDQSVQVQARAAGHAKLTVKTRNGYHYAGGTDAPGSTH